MDLFAGAPPGGVRPAEETAAVFFILASGMTSRWRTSTYLQYRALATVPRAEPEVQEQEASA